MTKREFIYFVSRLKKFGIMIKALKNGLTDIIQMCHNKMVEMGYSEPTEMMINICAGTVVNGLAETKP